MNLDSSADLRRERELATALGHLDLPFPWFCDALASNPSKDLPYHGEAHAVTTAVNTFYGARAELLGPRWTAIAVIAAVFHDFNHTGGPDHDSVNISRAVEAFTNILDTTYAPTFVLRNHYEIASLIQQTEHPHARPTNMAAAVLQDADVMQTFEPDRNRFIDGLRQETARPLTDEDAIEFVANHRMNTVWGRGRQVEFLGTRG